MTAEPELRELRELVAEFQPNRGHVMPALHKVQNTYGYIPRSAFEVIARQLNSTPALIYGAATFYSDYRLHPPAETEVAWCCGPACRVLGGDRVREALQEELASASTNRPKTTRSASMWANVWEPAMKPPRCGSMARSKGT